MWGESKRAGWYLTSLKRMWQKKEGIYNPEFKYGPIPVIVDANFVMPGLNEVLKEMKVGEKKTVEVPPENGFGKRFPDLIKLIPESKFREQDIDPTPGQTITMNKAKGVILS
ncbi:MAG: FKBP-type peptidyl-prolyl cis-trans isomerase, partial [Candidatus Aenigmatarchaeota archaeon]